MKRKAQRLNHATRKASKRIRIEKLAISVTQEHNHRGRATSHVIDSPSKRYATLEPWLWLANLAPRWPDGRLIHPQSVQDDTVQLTELWNSVLSRRHFSGWRNNPIRTVYRLIEDVSRFASHTAMLQWLFGFVHHVAFGFESYMARDRLLTILMWGGLAEFGEFEGRVSVEISDPYREFIDALRGTQIDRIRRCPVCRRFFYQRRAKGKGGFDSSTKACSPRCNQTRRVQEWRSRQPKYEQNRKFKRAGVKPEGKAER